ncbi:MAG: hypothetical protein HON23_05700 [Rickettsiales bacterium]|nr:hypothetical protein [Rickettsiales bacterium]
MVIISLLIIVTSSARRLFVSAEINNVVSSTRKVAVSVGVFVSVYESFPGDLANATSYWPNINTTDGDGDSKIESESYESTNALIHMSSAGVIKSQEWAYDSLYQAYVMDGFKYGGAILVSNFDDNGDARSGFTYVPEDGNYIKFGSGSGYDDEIFTPTELYLIDAKIDNGNAHTGQMVMKVSNAASDDCSDSEGVYNSAIETDSCLFLYHIDILALE